MVLLKEPRHVHEVGKRTRDAVHLIDHDHVDAMIRNILEELLKCRTVRCPAGEATVVVMTVDEIPSLGGLALHIRGASIELGLK